MRKALDIALLYLKITFSERSTLLFAFILPLIFTFSIGQAIRGFSEDEEGPRRWSLDVVNEDGGDLAANLVQKLERNDTLAVTLNERNTALARVGDGDVSAVLIIPAGFTEAIRTTETAALDFHTNSDDIWEGQLIEQAVAASVTQLTGSLNAAAVSQRVAQNLGLFAENGEAQQAYTAAALAAADSGWQSPPVIVETQQTGPAETPVQNTIPSGMTQSSPGMLVLFSMFFMMGGTTVLVQEREEGTLRRLLVMPMSKAIVIFGKLLGIYISGIIQVAILIVAGALLFGVNWGQSPLALIIVVITFAFAITSLGMLIAAIARTLTQANSLPTIVILPMAALGGAMWPLDIVPSWMRTIGYIFPTAWAMDAFQDIITRGLGIGAILPEAAILLGYGIVFLVLGISLFRYE